MSFLRVILDNWVLSVIVGVFFTILIGFLYFVGTLFQWTFLILICLICALYVLKMIGSGVLWD